MTSKLNPPPISKKCRVCSEEKLLSEFDLSNKSKDDVRLVKRRR
jgi:hypothetical protein